MPFTREPMNYAAQYSRELANAYPYLAYFSDMYNAGDASRFRPLRGASVEIPSMQVSGARAVNRDSIDGKFTRNFNLAWETKTMEMYREWDTLIDPMDMVQTDEVATIANVTRTFNEFQKIPEQDAYMASKCAAFASDYGGTDSAELTADGILASWDSYLAYMTDQRINRDRLRAYITPAAYKLLKEAAGITRFIDTGTGIRDIDRNVGRLDGVLIREVPSDVMKTEYDFTEGWEVTAGAKQINLLLADPMSVVAPIVYEQALISPPSAQSKGKWLYYESYFYDVFVLNQRQAGFFANIGSAPTLGTVDVTSAEGAATGATVITYASKNLDQNGNPYAGLDVYITSGNTAAPTVTYGAELPSGATWTKVSGQNPVNLTGQTAGKYVTVAIVNRQKNVAVAAGSAVEVVGE